MDYQYAYFPSEILVTLKQFYGKPDEVVKYSKEHSWRIRVVSALKLFMQLNEGDIIAIKSDGQPRKGKKNKNTLNKEKRDMEHNILFTGGILWHVQGVLVQKSVRLVIQPVQDWLLMVFLVPFVMVLEDVKLVCMVTADQLLRFENIFIFSKETFIAI